VFDLRPRRPELVSTPSIRMVVPAEVMVALRDLRLVDTAGESPMTTGRGRLVLVGRTFWGTSAVTGPRGQTQPSRLLRQPGANSCSSRLQ